MLVSVSFYMCIYEHSVSCVCVQSYTHGCPFVIHVQEYTCDLCVLVLFMWVSMCPVCSGVLMSMCDLYMIVGVTVGIHESCVSRCLCVFCVLVCV